jgi:dihydrofolate synthase/folylpolyglutamate synthase
MRHLTHWLEYIRTLHHSIIDYSLERVHEVAARLELLHPNMPIIMVTGTNGKGSTVSAMEAILLAADYHVGSFTSPYLEYFNEQIRINATPIDDTTLIHAFEMIDNARGNISLSEFEFTTLAALLIFKNTQPDLILFEVGLGGGNDATNIIDPDVTVITSLALDHEEYLGATLELIAANEAQLLRPNKPGIIGVTTPPTTLTEHAKAIDAPLLTLAKDWGFEETQKNWRFWNKNCHYNQLPRPNILCKNAALAIQALLSCDLQFTEVQLQRGLQNINIKGRLQLIPGKPSMLIDVAHNLEAIHQLSAFLKAHKPAPGKVIAVFSMLKDKKITEVIKIMAPDINTWIIAPIDHPRAAPLNQLQDAFTAANISNAQIITPASLEAACSKAHTLAGPEDLILIFGSFFVARAGLTTTIYQQKQPIQINHLEDY